MRILLFIVLVLLPYNVALSASGEHTRIATELEIRQGLRGFGDLKEASNGYLYREGSQIGYKISNGQICVRKAGRSECFTIYTNGKRLEMIDSKGNREFLNQ